MTSMKTFLQLFKLFLCPILSFTEISIILALASKFFVNS